MDCALIGNYVFPGVAYACGEVQRPQEDQQAEDEMEIEHSKMHVRLIRFVGVNCCHKCTVVTVFH